MLFLALILFSAIKQLRADHDNQTMAFDGKLKKLYFLKLFFKKYCYVKLKEFSKKMYPFF